MAEQPTPRPTARYQLFVIGPNDLLRTSSGKAQLFDTFEDAEAAMREHGGIIQPEGARPPGGFDHSFHS